MQLRSAEHHECHWVKFDWKTRVWLKNESLSGEWMMYATKADRRLSWSCRETSQGAGNELSAKEMGCKNDNEQEFWSMQATKLDSYCTFKSAELRELCRMNGWKYWASQLPKATRWMNEQPCTAGEGLREFKGKWKWYNEMEMRWWRMGSLEHAGDRKCLQSLAMSMHTSTPTLGKYHSPAA